MTSPVDAAIGDLSRALDALGLGWFLFGAQAAIIYGSTRVTEDIDVTVDLGDHTTRELVSALTRKGFGLRVGDTAGFVEKTRVLPVIHLATAMPVDVVFAGPGLEELFLSRLHRHERGGTLIPVASPEDLIVMKLLAGRPRDIEDVRSVLRALGPKLDMPMITTTLKLIEEALGQSDLQPLLAQLKSEPTRRTKIPPPKRSAASRTKAPAKKRK